MFMCIHVYVCMSRCATVQLTLLVAEHTCMNVCTILIIFMVIFNLMLLDVETESENWIFLKYGRIGKHPVQSPYTRYYCTL